MPSIETYRKRAKQLLRWHRQRNYSVGEKVRLLERYRHLTDVEVLAMAMPLTLAQEVVAIEAGFLGWAALKAGGTDLAQPPQVQTEESRLASAVPILFVRDVSAAAKFYEEALGFQINFLHGQPPFYASVSRDRARLHLRLVHDPNFCELAARETSLTLVAVEVCGVKTLFHEYESRRVTFTQPLVIQPWGGLDFHVRDPDGNVVAFVQYTRTATAADDEQASEA